MRCLHENLLIFYRFNRFWIFIRAYSTCCFMKIAVIFWTTVLIYVLNLYDSCLNIFYRSLDLNFHLWNFNIQTVPFIDPVLLVLHSRVRDFKSQTCGDMISETVILVKCKSKTDFSPDFFHSVKIQKRIPKREKRENLRGLIWLQNGANRLKIRAYKHPKSVHTFPSNQRTKASKRIKSHALRAFQAP